jgi:hypothetical protein
MEVFTREHKTGKLRRVMINKKTADFLRRHLQTSRGEYVFEGATRTAHGELLRSPHSEVLCGGRCGRAVPVAHAA